MFIDTPNWSVQHGATLPDMPTAHPRHTITETPPVREVLDELRAALGRQRLDFAEAHRAGGACQAA